MNFKHLKYFIATAESGQISKAASAMNITQSAITNAIKDLEFSLKVKLFTRSSKGMEVTASGREFLQSAYDILNRIERAYQIKVGLSNIKGTVNLAISYTVVGYFLPAHLEKLHHLYPDIRINIHEATLEEIEEGLTNLRYDLALILTSNTSNPELKKETLLRSNRRLWVPYGHRFADQQNINFEQIAEEPYILLTVDGSAHTTLKYWSETDHRPNVKIRTSSIEAVRSMVANGQGVTILSDMVYRPWSLEGKRIFTSLVTPNVPTMDIGLAWQKFAGQSEATMAIMKYFREM